MHRFTDVGVNRVLKANLTREWEWWFHYALPQYTAGGARKKPTYQEIVGMVGRATRLISAATIKTAFEACGLAPDGAIVSPTSFHARLNALMTKSYVEDAIEDDVDACS